MGTSMHWLWNDFTLMDHIADFVNHKLGFNRQRDGRKIGIYATLWLAKRGREMRIFGKYAGGFYQANLCTSVTAGVFFTNFRN